MYAVKLISFQGKNQLIKDLEYTKQEIKKNNQVLVKVKAIAVNPINLQMFQEKIKHEL